MNSIVRLKDRIASNFPAVVADLYGPPVSADGLWILDVHAGDTWLYLQGKATSSVIGVADNSSPHGSVFGAGVDEVLESEEAAYQWVVDKLKVL